MGSLNAEMQRLALQQRLGYAATVCPDGTPNLSPKGTTQVWDDDHLIFADIASPRTVANLRHHPAIELNVVDPISRQGYRFKGQGTVVTEGPLFERALAFYRAQGTRSPIRAVVLIRVERAWPLVSPAYDDGTDEATIRRRWRANCDALPPVEE